MDHFFLSESISKYIKEADVLHLPSNTSDHCPIYCTINTKMLPKKCRSPVQHKPKANWNNASNEQRVNYIATLENNLRLKSIPMSMQHCQDVHCHNANHHNESDDFMIEILQTLKSTAEKCLPSSRGKFDNKKTLIHNWNEEIQPLKEKAMFWHAVWQSAGRPINTELHRVMKRTRNIYHLYIKKNKRMVDTFKKNALLNACINNKGDIFDVIKKQRRAAPTVSTMIDGMTSDVETHFAKTYRKLYNSVNDQDNIMKVKQFLEKKVNPSSIADVERITPSIVEEAIRHLKNNKTDPVFDLSSDCLKNAPFILCEQLTLLFKHYVTHGHISLVLMVSTLIPLVKDKLGDITASSNYRSIALCSLILKVFDWVVLLLYSDDLKIDELQFGFQEKTSTSMCTWLAVEAIEYFMRNGSDVYVCVMDMTKAFDKVQHSKLFWKLVDKGIPPIYIRILLIMYEKQQAAVRWNNILSETFPMSNGVKQGAVMSPILYCVYTDCLLKLLRTKKTGCWVNGEYVGIVAYADDLLLLSPTLDGLQDMIRTCENYGNDHNLTFSTNPIINKCKTKCLAFLKKARTLRNLQLNGRDLPWVDAAKHLGCKIGPNNQGLKRDLMEKRAMYINRVNELKQ